MANPTDKSVAQHSSQNDGLEKTRLAGGKFLTFFLGAEEYGIEILSVNEIIGMLPITRVPGTPDHICGIINLRGKIIPIVDLRRKFGMESKKHTSETCIIVVHAQALEVGTIVDRVSEVVNIAACDIEPPPSFGKGGNIDYILGIGKTQAKVRILLDIDRVLSADQLQKLSGPEASGEESVALAE